MKGPAGYLLFSASAVASVCAANPFPISSWPPDPLLYSWAIEDTNNYHIYMSEVTIGGYDVCTFNMTGPQLISPLPLIGEAEGAVPEVIVPSFRASCNFTEYQMLLLNGSYIICDLDPAFTPLYLPEGCPPNWGMELSFLPSAVDRYYGLAARFSFVFWSEYGNNTWQFTTDYLRSEVAEALWWPERNTRLNVFPQNATQIFPDEASANATASADDTGGSS